MSGPNRAFAAGGFVFVLVFAGPVLAQQVTMGSPMHSVSSGFYEQIGTTWNFNYKGMQVNFGGGGYATPAYGGYQAGAGLNSGVSVIAPGFSGQFNFTANQGNTQNFTSTTPSVTVMNGQTGYVSDTSQTPFVISYIPVVGGYSPVMFVNPAGLPATSVQLPTFSNFGAATTVDVPDGGDALLGGVNRAAEGRNEFGAPGLPKNRATGATNSAHSLRATAKVHNMAEMDEQLLSGAQSAKPAAVDAGARALGAAQSSSAGRGAMSVAEARRLREREQQGNNEQSQVWFDRGVAAEAQGKLGAAKAYFQMVARRATGELQQAAIERLAALGGESSDASVVKTESP